MHVAADQDSAVEDRGAIGTIRALAGCGVAAAWLVLILANAGPSVSSFSSTVVSPLGSTIAARFGGGDAGALIAQLGLTLPAIGVIIGSPFSAWLIARLGYRWVVIASTLVLAVSGTICAYLDDIVLFLGARFLVGLSSAIAFSVLMALSGAVFRGVTLGRMISYQNGISAFVGMGLVLISGGIASRYGWQASFFMYLACAVFAVLALFAWFPARLPPSLEAESRPRERVSLRPLLPVYLVTIGTYAIVFMVIVQGSLLMSANGIDDPSVQSVVIAASTITYAAMATMCSWIETHVTRNWTFTVALTCMASGMLLMGLFPFFEGALAGSFLIGAGSGISASYLTTYVIKHAPEGGRNQAVGWIAPAHYVGQLSNPIVMQYLRVTFGINAAFVLVGLVLCAAVLASALFSVRAGGRTARLAPSA